MKAVKLMTEAYRLLLEAASSLREAKLHEGEHFQHLRRSADELAISLTEMRLSGIVDPSAARELDEELRKTHLREGEKAR